jgi:hypothetical protein
LEILDPKEILDQLEILEIMDQLVIQEVMEDLDQPVQLVQLVSIHLEKVEKLDLVVILV